MRQPPFVILGTPRSRTAWLAKFLTWGRWTCDHEPSMRFLDVTDLAAQLTLPHHGISDSALTLKWRDVLCVCSRVRVVVVHRPLDEICRSLAGAGFPQGVASFPALYMRLKTEISDLQQNVATLDVPFATMARKDVAAAIFRHCLGVEMPEEHWQAWKDQNVQVDVRKQADETIANQGRWGRFYAGAFV